MHESGKPDKATQQRHFDCLVIGAGPSGLVTLKELREQGLSVLAFDAQDDLGGAFRSSYDFLRLVISNNHIAFGSFPPGDEANPVIWDKFGYLDYLRRFAEHFDLLPHIRFSEHVSKVVQGQERGYVVTVEGGAVYTSDNVVVCTGANALPKKLDLPGIGDFRGEVLHSVDVKDGKRFEGRKVLIVGLGESASDIALEVAKYAATTCISSRGGPGFVIPRRFGGTVTDLDTNRCYHSLPFTIFDRWPVKFKVWLERFYVAESDDRAVLKLTEQFNRANRTPWKLRTSTKSTSFIEAILYHNTQYKGAIDLVEPDRVVFEDLSEFACDTIIDCTGFTLKFPFLESLPNQVATRVETPRRLFKRMIIPEIGPELAFVGFIRPAVGAIPPCAEMQARYLALLLSGKRQLPSLDEMKRNILWSKNLDKEQFSYHYGKVFLLSDYLRFLDGIATHIGCMPPLRKSFFTDIRLWFKLMFTTLSGIHYRLRGPGHDFQTARAVLLRMPTMPAPVIATELVIKTASEIVSWVARGLSLPRRWKVNQFPPVSRMAKESRSGVARHTDFWTTDDAKAHATNRTEKLNTAAE